MSDGEKQLTETTQEDKVSILQQPSADIVFATPSDILEFDSEKAREIAAFDDSRIKILGHREISMEIRGERGKANPSVNLENFYIVPGLNGRLKTPEWEDHIEWLTGRIIQEGFREDCPLLVFPTVDGAGNQKYGIISGESRYHAATRAAKRGAAIKSLPVVLCPEGSSMEEMSVQVATSNSGKPFTPLEMAYFAQRFAKWRKEPAEIAAILKVSTNYVNQLLRIAAAPHEVRSMIQDGDVSFGTALASLTNDSTGAVESLKKGVAMAKAAGKTRLTNKFLPEKQAQKAARTYSVDMLSLLKRIHANEMTMGLIEEEERLALTELVGKIDQLANATPESIAEAKAKKEAEEQAKKEASAKKKQIAAANKEKVQQRRAAAAAKKAAKPSAAKASSSTTKSSKKPTGTDAKPTTRVRDQSAAAAVDNEDVQQHPDD
ncbi:hypothetical protein DZC30_18715 [Comamonas testosteroni]|uniref:ParB/Sulfiredoxin domain-containing protein n=1 Tax=Comamonas testosteroni TaxID=285 RepID=A0A373FCW8_COMTE|nr:hypothetical protein [Comamonas testosteroni]RGE41342.1 hypothetical protein DZC30_18715 [Comamonas testosteroni]